MKKIVLILLLALSFIAKAQVSRIYYPSNYIRVVQPDVDDSSDLGGPKDLVSYNPKAKMDTLLNPFTGGLNNANFFNIDFNGDGIRDLYIFDRDLGENQFLLFEGLSKNSINYRYAPQYHHSFPQDVSRWVEIADYNKDGLPDLFTNSTTLNGNTRIKAYKNTSYLDKSGKYIPQFTMAADPLFYTCDTGGRFPIDITTASNPQFVDIDRDGHLDILAWDIGFTAPMFFRNVGKDTDSLNFYFTKKCWGYFEEFLPHVYWPWTCEKKSNGDSVYTGTCDPDPVYKGIHSSVHQYNAMSAFDVDCDGDIDILMSDGLFNSLVFLKNGNIDLSVKHNGYGFDTIENIHKSDTANPTYPANYPAIINMMPIPSYVDINHDSLNDLVVAAGEPTILDTVETNRTHNIWYYDNQGSKDSATGRPTANIFEMPVTKDFLQNTMVDWGINSAPCFIDVDNDGRKDLIVAVKDGGGSSGASHLVLYLNKKGKTSASKPYLIYQTNDYLGFSKLKNKIYWPVPAAYFNAMDKKTDMLMGNASGQVMYFKNEGGALGTISNFHLSTSALLYKSRHNGKMYPINVGSENSAPTAGYISKDSDMDLIIGSNYASLCYYRCIGYLPGPDHVPYFDSVTSELGGNNIVAGYDHQTTPCLAVLDTDKKLDLIVGTESGNLYYYHDFDTSANWIPQNRILIKDIGANKVDSNRVMSSYIIPAVADLDGDGLPDIMLGCLRGGLIFLGSNDNGFENLRNHTGIEQAVGYKPTNMGLFPNPARDMVTFEYYNAAMPQNAQLIVADMLGRQLIKHPFRMQNGKGDERISTSGITNGIYIVEVISGDQLIFSNKLVIYK